MDVLEILKTEHQRIKSLFADYEATENEKERRGIVSRLKQELLSHFSAEESVFYPYFEKYPEFKALVSTSIDEHQEAKTLLVKLDRADSEQLDTLVMALKTAVDSHISKEETEFFSLARRSVRRGEREAIGRHMQAGRPARAAA